MRNVDDGCSVGLDLRNLHEQPFGFGGGQRFGRFVEYENFWPQRQSLGDLDELSLCHGEIANAGTTIEARAHCGELFSDPGAAALRCCASMGRYAVKQVLGDREVV